MSRILVVEPRNILRQAISLALFPDHEVQTVAVLSESDAALVKEFDLVMIDSAAWDETNTLNRQLVRWVQGWKVPTIWIDDGGGPRAPTSDNLVVLTRPIQKDSLQSAVTKSLATSSSLRNGNVHMTAKKAATKEAKIVGASQVAGPQIIELVDVVEEAPEPNNGKKQQRKTK
jgi:hypothetical protein